MSSFTFGLIIPKTCRRGNELERLDFARGVEEFESEREGDFMERKVFIMQ